MIKFIISVATCFCLLPVMNGQDVPATNPNIIFIMADDLGYGDLGCYGQEKIQTPNIDKLASEGMTFTQAYAGSSVCAPSRSSLMTGFHNGHNRIRDNLPHGIFLRPDDFMIAELLKQAGYRTGGGMNQLRAIHWSDDGRMLAYNRKVTIRDSSYYQVFLLTKQQ